MRQRHPITTGLALTWATALVLAALTTTSATAVGAGISGTVTGPGAVPVAGATVTAHTVITADPGDQVELASTTTAGDGTYSLAVDEGADVVVCFKHPDFVEECWDGEYRSPFEGPYYADPITVDADGVQGVDATLITGSSIAGTLTNDEGGSVAGALVMAQLPGGRTYSAISDAGGGYAIEHVEPGTYTVCVLGTTTMNVCTSDVGGPASFTVDEDDEVTGVDLELETRPHELRVALSGDDRLRWAWAPVTGATTYQVAVSTSPTMSNPRQRWVAGPWATFTGLTPGRTYYAAVRAQSDGLGFDEATTARSTIVAGRAGTVSGLRQSASTADSVTVGWAAYATATSYRVRISSSLSFAGYRTSTTSGATEATFGALASSTTYYVKVQAWSGGAPVSAWSPARVVSTGS